MASRWELTVEQWELVEPILRPTRRKDNRGRPWHDARAVLHGAFWVLGTGVHWSELPAKYPPYQTCHRRFQQWVREGRLVEVLRRLARHLHERGKLNLDEAFVDATFEREKRGFAVGPTKRGKGTKIVPIASGDGLALAVTVESASPAECRLVEAVLPGYFLDEPPARLIGGKAYDSDALDKQMSEYGVEMISPNRINRKEKTQDGRPLRRYKRRWKVERLFAWMQNFRRPVTRWEYRIENFLGFVHLAYLLILSRHLESRDVARWFRSVYLFPALSSAGASLAAPCSFPHPARRTWTCRFPASGSRRKDHDFAHEKLAVRCESRSSPS